MSDNGIVPTETKRGLYKPKEERLALDAWIAKMILSGYKQTDLVSLYKEEFNRNLTQSTVSKTITKLKEEWRLSKREDIEFHTNMELERLDVMEQAAWENYYSCGGTLEDVEIKEVLGLDGGIESLRTTKTKSDPRLAMQWFDKILKIQKDRRMVLRLESTVNINNVLALKAYAHFDPSSDWPDKNLPEANVIDAEFAEKGKE